MNDFNLDKLQIFNREKTAKLLGSEELVDCMIDEFYERSLNYDLTLIGISLDTFNYESAKVQIHSLKGSASYLNAERIIAICDKIEMCIDKQDYKMIFAIYPLLIEQCIVFKKVIHNDFSRRHGI